LIYVTGDKHRVFDSVEEFCDMYDTNEEDILIILGDAGINFYLDESDEEIKEYLYQLPITLFCIHGNHEERPDEIGSYRIKEWNGGQVYYEEDYPNLLFAMDGEIYDFDGKKALAIGGAYSIDKYYRLSGNLPWFPTEQPDDWIKARVERKLESVGWKVDYVLSHTCPLKYMPVDLFLPNVDQSKVDKSTEEWLDTIEEKLDYDIWYFGHYHADRYIGQAVLLFEDFLELGE